LHYDHLLIAIVEFQNCDIALSRNGSMLVTAGSPEPLGNLTVGKIDLSEVPVKFPGRCCERWLHYDDLLTGWMEFPNYDLALFRNGSTLATASNPESLTKLTVGMIDLPKVPVKFPGSCSERWLEYDHLPTGRVEFPNYDIALFRNGSTLVTASRPQSLGKLTVGIINLPKLPIRFPGC
jgi:hypothetical protein